MPNRLRSLAGVTLLALSLTVGLLIDDAIVVRENIVRHVEMGKDHFRAAHEGTDEIGLAVAATTFSIISSGLRSAFRLVRSCLDKAIDPLPNHFRSAAPDRPFSRGWPTYRGGYPTTHKR